MTLTETLVDEALASISQVQPAPAPVPQIQRVERRSVRRKSVFLRARVRGQGISTPIHCVVRNISPMGALLNFERPVELPYRFRLLIDSDFFDADCEIRHQRGEIVGVEFTSSRREALAKYS